MGSLTKRDTTASNQIVVHQKKERNPEVEKIFTNDLEAWKR